MFNTFVDERTQLEMLRRTDIVKLARKNGIQVTDEMTKGVIIPMLEGRGIMSAPEPKIRESNPHAVADARKQILEDIEKMKPSELYALAKEMGVEMTIRMTADEKRAAKKKLCELM